MDEITRPMLVVYAAAAIAVALIGARYLITAKAETGVTGAGSYVGGSDAGGGATAENGTFREREVVVHVTGAVRRPGLITLGDGARVGDAVRRAGGPTRAADLTAVNLAMHVADGQQVIVPARAAGGSGLGGASGTTGPISLNSATAEQLDQLDGVGPGLAAKIIAARQQSGGFGSVDDLGEVPGIGDKRLESLRAQLQP